MLKGRGFWLLSGDIAYKAKGQTRRQGLEDKEDENSQQYQRTAS
jgi:hypothetical protein